MVGLRQRLLEYSGGSDDRAKAEVARVFLEAVMVGLKQRLLKHSWRQ